MKIVNMMLAGAFLMGVTAVALCQEGGASRPQGTFGTLVKVDGQNLVIKQMARPGAAAGEAKEVTVATNDKTKFTVDGNPDAKISDLKADMRVMVSGSPADKVVANTPGLGGMVVKVDGKNLVIKTRGAAGGEPKEVTVVTDEKTKVIIDEKAATLADLKADMRVNILPATGTAEKIVANTGGPGGGRPGGRGGRGNGGGAGGQ